MEAQVESLMQHAPHDAIDTVTVSTNTKSADELTEGDVEAGWKTVDKGIRWKTERGKQKGLQVRGETRPKRFPGSRNKYQALVDEAGSENEEGVFPPALAERESDKDQSSQH